jgi:hypothetical protein
MKTKRLPLILGLAAAVVATYLFAQNSNPNREVNSGELATLIRTVPEADLLTAMAAESASQKVPINWDEAIGFADDLIALGKRVRAENGEQTIDSNLDSESRMFGIHQELLAGAQEWTERVKKEAKTPPPYIVEVREMIEAREQALIAKYGKEFLDEARDRFDHNETKIDN